MASRIQIIKMIAIIKLAFPNFNPDIESEINIVDVWNDLLNDVPDDLLEISVKLLITEDNRAFPPSIGEIRGKTKNLLLKSKNIPTSYEAYEDILKAGNGEIAEVIEEDGQYTILKRKYQFKHPLVLRVAEMLGYPKYFPTDNPVADRSQYMRVYDDYINKIKNQYNTLPELDRYINTLEKGENQNEQLFLKSGQIKSLSELLQKPDNTISQMGKAGETL